MKVELENGTGCLNSFIPSSDKMKDKRNLEVETCSTSNNAVLGEGTKKNTVEAGDENAEQHTSNQSNFVSEIEEISLKGLVVRSPDKSAHVEHRKDDAGLKILVTDENINPAIKFRCPFCNLIVCGNEEFLKHILRHGENYKTDDKTTKQSENDEKPDKIAIKNSKRLKFRLSHPSMKSSSTISQLPRSKQTKSSDPPVSKSKTGSIQASRKKIPCKICKNMYYTYYMRIHMMVHTGERSFSCLFCSQAFAIYGNLKAHMESLHKKTINLASYKELSAEKTKLKQNQLKNSITSSSKNHVPPETEAPVDSAANIETEQNSLTEPSKGKSKTVSKGKKTLEKTFNRRNCQRSQGKSYECQICSKRFKFQSTLKYHQFTHSEERPFKCQFCDVSCRHPSNLNKHIKLRHKSEKQADNFKEIESVPSIRKNKKIPCKICKNMYYPHYMSSHMTVHTGERKFSCLFCPQAFAVYCNLKAHMGSLHKKTINLASYRELSAEKTKLKQNQVKNSSATASSPKHTPETVDSAANTELEQNSSTEPSTGKSKTVPRSHGKSYKCQLCPKRFNAQSTLKYHQFIHSEERPFKCQFCDVACRHPSNLNSHIKRHHKNEKQADSFKTIESVPSKQRSSRTTSAVEINSYDSKQEEDSNAISLTQKDVPEALQAQKTRKIRKRKSPKSFPSPSPPTSSLKKKRSRRKGKQRKGMKIQCWFPNCGKTFGSNQALEIHYRVHTNEKPYNCDTCSKKFSQISSLQRHKKIVHLGIKSYKCPYCDKATSSSWNMKLHIHVNHKKLASVDGKVK